jgi:rhodanese-related sulfurtransferase
MKEISAQELVNIAESATVLDVRETFEYIDGHFPGAILMPLATVPDRFGELDTQTAYHVICEAGVRSAKACDFLTAKGFDVTNISGGTGLLRMISAPLNLGETP